MRKQRVNLADYPLQAFYWKVKRQAAHERVSRAGIDAGPRRMQEEALKRAEFKQRKDDFPHLFVSLRKGKRHSFAPV